MSQHLVVSVEKGRWNTTMKPMFTESLLSPRHCSWNVSYFSYLPVKLEALGAHLFSSVTQLCRTLCEPMDYSTPGFPVHYQLPELTQNHTIESVMPSNDLIFCHPLLLLPSIFPNIRVFLNESVLCIMWPKYLSFSFSISPSNEYIQG